MMRTRMMRRRKTSWRMMLRMVRMMPDICRKDINQQLGEPKKVWSRRAGMMMMMRTRRMIMRMRTRRRRMVSNICRKELDRQLGEAKKGLAEANRDGQAAAARIRALHAELEEVRWAVSWN